MRRNFVTGLALCLVPTFLAALFVGQALYLESKTETEGTGFRRGIDLAGGTILVYEINTDAARKAGLIEDGQGGGGLSSDNIRRLAESLKRRIDPNDLRGVVVRPVGNSRVEIILPTSSKTGVNADYVQEVKSLVGQVGVLEFRILANLNDDNDATRDAVTVLERADNKAELDRRAKAGEVPPPPAPSGSATDTPGQYSVKAASDAPLDGVTYEWIALGKEEMESLFFERDKNGKVIKDADGTPVMNAVWKWFRDPQNAGKVFQYQQTSDRDAAEARRYSFLLFRRDFSKERPTKAEEGTKSEYFVLARVSPLDGLKIDREAGLTARTEVSQTTGKPEVLFFLAPNGAARMGKMTERNRPTQGVLRSMAIVMDNKVVSAPTLNAVLRESGTISGSSFDLNGVNRLVRVLQSGALNAELKPDPVSENTVGPTLGQDTIKRGLWAVGLSFLAVLAFMVVYYEFAGVVACVALFANLLLTVGFMNAVSAAFTLPGLAGIVLMLGMAVDANVLIYERLREERAKGATLAAAIRNGYDRALPTIIDTHLTSIFTAVVLYTFGNDNLKGFAVSLTLGLIISLFTSLYMTRLVFDYAMSKRWITHLRMRQLFARPNFNFMKIRYPMLGLTGALTVLGLGLFLNRGEAVLNVDFTRGTAYGGRLRAGEERALTDTDKPGFLTLLGEDRQKERLKVAEVVPLADAPSDDPTAAKRVAGFVYKLKFTDGKEATVTFANPPGQPGDDEKAQLADVKARAQELPGVSVEQVYLLDDRSKYADGKSAGFTIRTTEREADLVQVLLDRLLRNDKDEPLLSSTKVTNVEVNGPVVTLTLDRPASPGYIKRFVEQELRLAGRAPQSGEPARVTGVETDGDPAKAAAERQAQQFSKVKVDVSGNAEFKALTDATAGNKPVAAGTPADAQAQALRRVVTAAVTGFEARPIPDRLETFDPTLAADTRNKALYAVVLSWLAILAYLWFRFGSWTFGLAAVVCLVHDLCFTLGAIALCHYVHDTTLGHLLHLQDFKIDLAAVAALLTLVGYSVNDTIVVFDRIREVRGKSTLLTPQMINDSVNQTLSRTVLASLTVFLVVGVLYWFGGEGVHLFSFVMVVGVLVGTYSSIYIASPLLLILGEGKPRPGDRAPAVAAPVETTV